MLSYLDATIYEDKKASGLALKEEKEKLENIAKETPGVVYQYLVRLDGSSCLPYASDGIMGIYGVTPESVKNDASRIFEILHVEDTIPVIQAIKKLFDNLSFWRMEYRVNHPTKCVIWVEGRATPKRLKNGDVLWHGFIMDITERKEMEISMEEAVKKIKAQQLFLEILIESAPIPIFYKNRDRVYMGCNSAYSDLCGLKKEDIVGKTVYDVAERERAARYEAGDIRLLANPNETQVYEYEVQNNKTGRTQNVIFFKRVYCDVNGESQGIIGSILDITKQKKYEKALKMFNEELSKRVENELRKRLEAEDNLSKERDSLMQSAKMAELGNMLGAIVHQWKQPINTIAVTAQNIKFAFEVDELTQEEIEQNIGLIMKQVVFMSKTAEDFQNFYKPSRERKDFLVCQNIAFIVEMLSKQLKLSNIEAEIVCAQEICATGYENEFKQVILNVISNAKDAFMEKKIDNKKIVIEIFLADNLINIRIQDNAGGINEELLPEKLFESFVSTKGDNGTGIGLAMCKTIITEHFNGKIRARNIENGAEFSIQIPLR